MKCYNFLCHYHSKDQSNCYNKNGTVKDCETRKRYNRIFKPVSCWMHKEFLKERTKYYKKGER